MKNSMEIIFKKLGINLPYDPAIPLLGVKIAFVDAVQFHHICLGVALFFLLVFVIPPVFVGLYLPSLFKHCLFSVLFFLYFLQCNFS